MSLLNQLEAQSESPDQSAIFYIMHNRFFFSQFKHVEDLQMTIEVLFQSITWFSYRRRIERPLLGSDLYSDAGWGCMLRTGQMILFQALVRHVLGDNFVHPSTPYAPRRS